MARLIGKFRVSCLLRFFAVFTWLSITIASAQVVHADYLLRRVDLEKTVRVRFALERSVFLVDRGEGDVTFHSGVHVELPIAQSRFDNSKLWLVTTRIDVPYQIEKINFGVLLVGTGGELGFVSPEKDPLPAESFSEATMGQLRLRLLSEQERLLRLSGAFKKRDDEYHALQNKLDLMTGGEELGILMEQERLIQARINSLTVDIVSIKRSLDLLTKREESAALAQRERRLSQQVSELAEAVRAVESRQQPGSKAQIDVEAGVALIERAAGHTIEELQQQLATLRQRRIDLRRQLDE